MRDVAPQDTPLPRQNWLSVLARATQGELAALLARHGGVPAHDVLKAPEVGTVMLEARAGGTGSRFNLGEATVARCVIRLDDGTIGVSYALGSDRKKAHIAALIDALLQSTGGGQALDDEIAALAEQQDAARKLVSRKAAATKVDFFTLVRGND